MGMIGARFGRNVPVDRTYPEPLPGLLDPNPRLVSRELLTRHEFTPATIVNVLAGAWLQFEVHDWFSHGRNVAEEPFELELAGDDPWAERPMRIERTRPDPSPDERRRTDLGDDGLALVGRLADLRQRPRAGRRAPRRRRRQASARPGRAAATRPRRQGRPDRRRRQLLARPRAPAHALHPRAQRGRRPAGAGAPSVDGRRAVREGAPRHRGADGEDPHGRVDARDHRPSDDPVRDAGQLVRHPRQAARQAQLERGARRHPGLADRPSRRPVLAHRGVRRRLSHAPAAAGRLHVPLDRDGRGAAGADLPRARRHRRPRQDRRGRLRERFLLVRDRAPRGDHAAQLPPLPPGAAQARRDRRRPRRDRRAPHPRAGRAALQRVPAALPPEAGGDVRGADGQSRLGGGAARASTGTSRRST